MKPTVLEQINSILARIETLRTEVSDLKDAILSYDIENGFDIPEDMRPTQTPSPVSSEKDAIEEFSESEDPGYVCISCIGDCTCPEARKRPGSPLKGKKEAKRSRYY